MKVVMVHPAIINPTIGIGNSVKPVPPELIELMTANFERKEKKWQIDEFE